jgi:putative ABC transport system permease protein
MDFISHLKEAFSNLVSSKLRSILAILGVLVGTGSVVALISSSQLATAHALQEFKTLGTNLLAVTLENDPASGADTAKKRKLTIDLMPEIDQASRQIMQSAPYTVLYQPTRFSKNVLQSQIMGVTENIAGIVKLNIDKGRFISDYDETEYYCVIGADLAKQISKFGIDPLYQQLNVGGTFFTIVGTLQPWPTNFFLFVDINQAVLVPLAASYYLGKDVEINNVLFRLVQDPNLDLAQTELTNRIKQLLPGKKVQIRSPSEIINIVGKQRETFTWLLAAIGGISLLVGGIGVMNIMLVSVVERRREIGIRMAIGAKRVDILQMFLIESVFLTVFGGLIGILLGIAISFFLTVFSGWEFQMFYFPPILGFVVSVLVGILSGFYPAFRASRLDPIQTLQAE